MDKISLQNTLRYVNFILGGLVVLCFWVLKDYIIEEQSISFVTSNLDFKEALPSFTLIILLTFSLLIYNRKQDHTAVFKFGYLVYVCLVAIFSLSFGHFRYVVEYEAFGTWVYHVVLCILLIIWNIVFVAIRHCLEKMST
ncbi:hypothetical protein ACIQ2D_07795 [Lysinibacillus sp. NPDC097287]|uniref:hypothetical protein n=1 Tax=Lysinibacillus sp. NPDC097287 TaxID=3364144 RepID=UPI0038272FE1